MRKRLYILYISIFCFLFLYFHAGAVTTEALTLKDVLKGIRFHYSLIKSGIGQYTVESNTIRTQRIIKLYEEVTYYFKSDRFRYNVFSKYLIRDSEKDRIREERKYAEYTYDGEVPVMVKYELSGIYASIGNKYPLDYNESSGLRIWGLWLFRRPLAEALEQFELELVGVENLEPRKSCYLIKAKPRKYMGYTFKIWIDPKEGYTMQKIEMIPITKEGTLAKKAPRIVKEIRYKEYPGGIWFPSEGILRYYSIEEDGKRRKESEITMKVKNFQLNVDIDDDVFKPTLKKGTIVHDRRTGSTYTVE